VQQFGQRDRVAGCRHRQAQSIPRAAIQLLGSNGHVNDYPTNRRLRDAKLHEINEIRRMLIDRKLFEKTA
jgi:alkylation response protein AidB-like acyl-CoA dehydrogenase